MEVPPNYRLVGLPQCLRPSGEELSGGLNYFRRLLPSKRPLIRFPRRKNLRTWPRKSKDLASPKSIGCSVVTIHRPHRPPYLIKKSSKKILFMKAPFACLSIIFPELNAGNLQSRYFSLHLFKKKNPPLWYHHVLPAISVANIPET